MTVGDLIAELSRSVDHKATVFIEVVTDTGDYEPVEEVGVSFDDNGDVTIYQTAK